jgi:hypothetical protein
MDQPYIDEGMVFPGGVLVSTIIARGYFRGSGGSKGGED